MTDPTSSHPPLIVRRIVEGDAEVAAGLSVQLGYAVTVDETRERIAGLAGREGSQAVFVACLPEGELVGWIEAAVTFHLQSAPFVLIGGLVVKDGVRGLGIGRRLCKEVEGWTRERGIEVIRVTSRSTRPDAHRFYLRDGYRETKISKVFEKTLG